MLPYCNRKGNIHNSKFSTEHHCYQKLLCMTQNIPDLLVVCIINLLILICFSNSLVIYSSLSATSALSFSTLIDSSNIMY